MSIQFLCKLFYIATLSLSASPSTQNDDLSQRDIFDYTFYVPNGSNESALQVFWAAGDGHWWVCPSKSGEEEMLRNKEVVDEETRDEKRKARK